MGRVSRFIRFANPLFKKCIVEEENDCLPDADALLVEIDKTLSIIKMDADPINLKIERPCKICGLGRYELSSNDDDLSATYNFGFRPAGNRTMKIFTCSNCAHVQIFSYERGILPSAWKK